MNKKTSLGIGFILVVIIAYQAYLLYKKDNSDIQNSSLNKEAKVDEPKININISPKKSTPKVSTPTSTLQNSNQKSNLNNLSNDEEKIRESFENLLQTIFSSKEIQEGLAEFKTQAQEGFKQMQKELQNLPQQLDKLSTELKDDPIFSQLFENIKNITAKELKDKGDYYYTKLTLTNPKNSKVDINADDKFLTIKITEKTIEKINNNGTIATNESIKETKTLISIPNDALIEKLQSTYKDGVIEIKIPKITKGQKI